MASSVHSLAIPSALQYLSKVRRFVVQHTSQADVPDEIVEACKLAVDEACTNVIKHAYDGQPEHLVDVTIIVDPDSITILICDDGRAFDATRYEEPDIARKTRRGERGGLGIHIMRHLMDEVEYRKQEGKNAICLIKRRT